MQSDSESEASIAVNGKGSSSRIGGLMRPTISSQNKAAPAVARRRGVQAAYSSGKIYYNICQTLIKFLNLYIFLSTVNLSSVGQEDSSSEETGNTNGNTSAPGTNTGKPAVPPRPSRTLVDSTAPHRKNMGKHKINSVIEEAHT